MADCPVHPGLHIEDVLQLDAGAIVGGARLLRDRNPLHNDPDAAALTHFGSLIACGPHAAGLHACMLPTYVTSLGFGVVGVEFTIRYRRPVLPDIAHTMWWTVEETEPRGRNWQVSWSGGVDAEDSECIAATGLILILGP
jgi:acyl dehydratase